MELAYRPMMQRWRSEIDRGRADADLIVGRMKLVVWQMVKVAFVLGLGLGLTIGGIFVWLMK